MAELAAAQTSSAQGQAMANRKDILAKAMAELQEELLDATPMDAPAAGVAKGAGKGNSKGKGRGKAAKSKAKGKAKAKAKSDSGKGKGKKRERENEPPVLADMMEDEVIGK